MSGGVARLCSAGTGIVVAVDPTKEIEIALHARRDHVEQLHSRSAQWVLRARGGQLRLPRQLAMLRWREVEPAIAVSTCGRPVRRGRQ